MSEAISIEHLIRKHSVPKVATNRVSHPSLLPRFVTRKVSSRDNAEFCTQLSVMLQSKISLHRALEVLAKQTTNPKMKQVVESLGKEIQKGSSFAKALSLQPDVFDNLFIVTAEVGQESGRLAEVLANLAEHLEKMNALKRKFTQALTYPALVIGVACLAVLFLLIFIVPTFAEMFKSFQVELPMSTQLVLKLSTWLTQYGKYALLIGAVIAFLSRQSFQSQAFKEKSEAMAFKIPLLGDILLKNYVARVCRTLGTMLQAQVSLVEALGVTQRIITNKEISAELGEILRHVKQGRTVAEPLVDSKMFPPMVAQMISVGEETSKLDEMLIQVAAYYEKEIEGKVDTLTSVMEPVIVLILGFVVAAILIAMYLPMFELVNVVGGQ